MNKKIPGKRFSGRRIVETLALNVLVFIGVYLFFGWFLKGSRVLMLNGEVVEGFTRREVWLCIILAVLLTSIINYQMLIRPIWNLENIVAGYRERVRDGEKNSVFEELEDSSIETVLLYLIKQQEVSHEKNRIEERQRKKAELYALQSQIDPHFLYNALDSIRGYALLHDMDEISDITEALSRVFRNMISDKQEQLPLRQEMDNINNYMRIQQFRFNDKFEYSFEVEEELLDKYMVPRMVLQPLVENAIMHGLERKIGGGWIRITAYATQRRFILVVADNGAGISEERLEFLRRALKLNPAEYGVADEPQHMGIALININRRIKLHFGKQYGITLNSTPDIRTTTEVVLPLLPNRR